MRKQDEHIRMCVGNIHVFPLIPSLSFQLIFLPIKLCHVLWSNTCSLKYSTLPKHPLLTFWNNGNKKSTFDWYNEQRNFSLANFSNIIIIYWIKKKFPTAWLFESRNKKNEFADMQSEKDLVEEFPDRLLLRILLAANFLLFCKTFRFLWMFKKAFNVQYIFQI